MVADLKVAHKNSAEHLNLLKTHPFSEQHSKNLIRPITENSCYCTICSTLISSFKTLSHTHSEEHVEKLERATSRAKAYTSDIKTDDNKNK